MAVFDVLLAARGAIEQWLLANPRNPNDDDDKKARRRQVVDAEQQLSEALRSIEDEELGAGLDDLGPDALALKDAATRIQNVERSFETVNAIVADAGVVVGILKKVLPG